MVTNEEKNRLPIFQERFRTLRGELSQAEFAKKVGTARPNIGFYENGERLPDALTLKKICETCDVTSDWLLGLSDVRCPDVDIIAINKEIGLSEEVIETLKKTKIHIETYKNGTIIPASYFDIMNDLIISVQFPLIIKAIDRYAKSIKDKDKIIEAENQFAERIGDKAYKDLDTDELNASNSFSEKEVAEIDKQDMLLWRIQQYFIALVKTITDKEQIKRRGYLPRVR